MTTAVVMVTVSSRVNMLNDFLVSLKDHEPGRAIHIHIQDPLGVADQIKIPRGVDATIQVTQVPIGCHAARVLALREMDGQGIEHYVNVDDDVLLLPQTNWQPAIDYTDNPGVGFVLTNWVRHPNLLKKIIPTMAEEFIPQVMIYNGGGMAYTNEIADLMRALDPIPARYDDIWPLTAYLNGFKNYRYRGSLAVHSIMGKGGMNTYMRQEPRPLLCWDWIDYTYLPKQSVGSEYAIPMDKDLRPIARETHKKARAARGWA